MKKTILINDGISDLGKQRLIKYNFKIIDKHIHQNELITFINENSISAILVRSATEIRKNIIDACQSIKLIGRGGVGMDNIDVEYAKKKGIHVINTPGASSLSVAELVFAHFFSMARQIYHSNRTMPLEGDLHFKKLKKDYSKGVELKGKNLGIIGFGKIGQEVAKIGLGLGMRVFFYDTYIKKHKITLEFYNEKTVDFELKQTDFNELLRKSDMITIHVPKQHKPLITAKELKLMKKTALIVNTARGGIIDEKELLNTLNNRNIKSAGLDVYEDEPTPKMSVLMNEYISLSPHIGAATTEAQERIGISLAEQINKILNG
ncbi:MAG: 3-phosphoglycerate dehydrogenase [Flavobacteriales bacterium]|nr:3-phosphoglycerate dehydrogenase [Flavobacteriales bacterium]